MNQINLHKNRKTAPLPLLWGGLLSTLLMFSACERRELTYYTEAEISVTVDWSRAGLEAEKDYGATLIVYPDGGDKPYLVLMGERESGSVRLPSGKYDAVLFNRSFDDFGALAFRNWQTLETFEAYSRKMETRNQTRTIVSSPERLAGTHSAFVVTDNMLGNYAPTRSENPDCTQDKCRLQLTPLPLTREVKVILNVKGLHNVREAQCTLLGVPLSIFMRNGQPGNETGGQVFGAGDPTFTPGSISDGTLTGTINTFGIQKDASYELKVKALLVDGKTVIEQVVTNAVAREETDEQGNPVFFLEVDVPDPFPNVKPEGGTDSGFDAEVDDWKKEENVDIDI